MDHETLKKLHAEGLISDGSLFKAERRQSAALFSLHWEVKILLYLGILLLTTGLGIAIYKNINTIGHQAVLAFIALVTGCCFVYCFKHKGSFSIGKVTSPNTFFDYLLLLGTLCFLIFVGYLQYQYKVFGTNYGLATFIPMLVLFYISYSFDNAGILNMAIVNLGVWLGVSITPKQLLAYHTFDSATVIYTYLGFGLLLLVFGWATKMLNFKHHFQFSYQHYGVHISFIALLAGYFFFNNSTLALLWLAGVFVLSYVIYKHAMEHKSFYFLLLTILYGYIALSSLIMRGLMTTDAIMIILIYFILSSLGMVGLLIHLNKKLKGHDHLQ